MLSRATDMFSTARPAAASSSSSRDGLPDAASRDIAWLCDVISKQRTEGLLNLEGCNQRVLL